jgi:hypothetical protein
MSLADQAVRDGVHHLVDRHLQTRAKVRKRVPSRTKRG